MSEQLKTEVHEAQSVQVLNFWQVFVVRPTGPCFLPRPGPNFRIFIGMQEHDSRIIRTGEIVEFDALEMKGRCSSGKSYQLGPKVGFTQDMQLWFKRRISLAAAGAADVTSEVVELSRHARASSDIKKERQMREHEIKQILKWVGYRPGAVATEQMLRDAIHYAHRMGYTDGNSGR
jgi:hypothetical protein